MVAALINYTTLIVIGLYLLYEAVVRFIDPQPVAGWIIIVIAGIALVVDIVTVMIAGYILWQSAREIGPVIRILMLGSPPDIETDSVFQVVRATDGVKDIHHAHFWQMDEHRAALDAHIVVASGRWFEADDIKQSVKDELRKQFGIAHTTLELECAHHACNDATDFGGSGHVEDPSEARER